MMDEVDESVDECGHDVVIFHWALLFCFSQKIYRDYDIPPVTVL